MLGHAYAGHQGDGAQHGAPRSLPIRQALWAVLGLACVMFGGVALSSVNTVGDAFSALPHGTGLNVLVIVAALLASALIVASAVILTMRMNQLDAIALAAAEARGALERADVGIATIARHRQRRHK